MISISDLKNLKTNDDLLDRVHDSDLADLTEEAQFWLARHEDHNYRSSIARKDGLSDELQVLLAGDDDNVRFYLVKNKHLCPEALRILVKSDWCGLREDLARRDDLPVDVMWRLMFDPKHAVQRAMGETISKGQLQSNLLDKHDLIVSKGEESLCACFHPLESQEAGVKM